MMFFFRKFFGIFLCLSCSCAPPLERPKIPVIPAIEWEVDYPSNQVLRDQKILQTFNFQHIAFGIPVRVNVEKGLVQSDTAFLKTFSQVVLSYSSLYQTFTLCFRFEGDTEVWLAQQRDLLPFFSSYTQWILKIIGSLPSKPTRIVLGSDIFTAHQESAWVFLINQLRENNISAKLLIAATPDRMRANLPWQLCDEIGLLMVSPEDGNHKKYARTWHPKIGNLASYLQKPIYIVRANLLEPKAEIPFKNLLRYWPENVQVSGIQLNTIFPTPIFADSAQPYGRLHDDDFLKTVHNYVR